MQALWFKILTLTSSCYRLHGIIISLNNDCLKKIFRSHSGTILSKAVSRAQHRISIVDGSKKGVVRKTVNLSKTAINKSCSEITF